MVSQQNPLPYQKTEQASRKVGFAELYSPHDWLFKVFMNSLRSVLRLGRIHASTTLPSA